VKTKRRGDVIIVKKLEVAGVEVAVTATEFNYLAGVTPGTAVASKALVVDAGKSLAELGTVQAEVLALENDVLILAGAGAPVDGTEGTGAGEAGKGSLYIDRTNAVLYRNSNTKASPTWAEAEVFSGVTAEAAEINQALDGIGENVTAANLDELTGAGDTSLHTHALADGASDVTSTADELNTLAGALAGATFVIGADAGTTINVGIQLEDAAGADIAARGSVFAYLSDDANGDSVAGTAPSGGWAIGTDGLLVPVVAGKAAQFVSEADGDIDITITEAGAATWYLVLVMPNGALLASDAIAFAGE
jgi:hypothetical protein